VPAPDIGRLIAVSRASKATKLLPLASVSVTRIVEPAVVTSLPAAPM